MLGLGTLCELGHNTKRVHLFGFNLHWSMVIKGQSTRVPSPKYDMDAYLVTPFGGEARDFC